MGINSKLISIASRKNRWKHRRKIPISTTTTMTMKTENKLMVENVYAGNMQLVITNNSYSRKYLRQRVERCCEVGQDFH